MTGRDRQAGFILALLYAGYLLSFGDRVIFGLAIKPIKAALSLSDTQIGLLSGLAFAAAYAVFSPLGGWMIDRGPRRWLFAGAVAAWSVATGATALAVTFAAMAAARAMVGIGEALLNPLAVSLIGDTVAPKRRPRAFAIYSSAGAVGSIAALLGGGVLVGRLVSHGGTRMPLIGAIAPWQGLFLGAAVPGVALALLVAAAMRDPARTGAATPASAPGGGLGFLRRYPRVSLTLFAGVSTAQMGAYTLSVWQIPFLERVGHWSATRAAVTLALTGGVATLVGCLLAGPAVAALRRRGHRDAPVLLALCAALCFATFAIVALLMPTPGLTATVMPLAAFWAYVPTVAAFSAMGEVLPPAARARLAGLHTLANGLIANSLGPFLVGAFSDRLFPGAGGLRWALVATLGLAGVAGATLIANGRREYRALAAGMQ